MQQSGYDLCVFVCVCECFFGGGLLFGLFVGRAWVRFCLMLAYGFLSFLGALLSGLFLKVCPEVLVCIAKKKDFVCRVFVEEKRFGVYLSRFSADGLGVN